MAAATSPRLMELGAAVVFMGYGRLEAFIAEAVATHRGRIFLLPAVRPDDLLPWTASADVCFVGQPPRTLNQRMNLPNKLFESLMAGVPVVVSEGNEQCRLVSLEGIGVCADVDDPAAIAAACASLLAAPADERRELRAHCRAVALERYTWEHTAVGLVELYRKLAREVAGGTSKGLDSVRDRRPRAPTALARASVARADWHGGLGTGERGTGATGNGGLGTGWPDPGGLAGGGFTWAVAATTDGAAAAAARQPVSTPPSSRSETAPSAPSSTPRNCGNGLSGAWCWWRSATTSSAPASSSRPARS